MDIAGVAEEVLALIADARDNLEASKFVQGSGSAEPKGISVAVGAVTFAYQVAEYRFKVWSNPKRWLKILLTVLGLAAAVFTYWMVRRYDATAR